MKTDRTSLEKTGQDPSDPAQERIALLGRVHEVQYTLWRTLDSLCERQGLVYVPVNETLLGAVREQGILPEEEKAEFAMPRADYTRFLEAAKTEIRPPFFLQTPENDTACFHGGYAVLRHNETAALEARNTGKLCHQGIGIIIYPLDLRDPDEGRVRRRQRRISIIQRLLFAKHYPLYMGVIMDSDPRKISLYYIVHGSFSHETLCRMLTAACTGCKKSDRYTIWARYYGSSSNGFAIPVKALENTSRIPFAGGTVPVPEGYGELLEETYGPGYLEKPGQIQPKDTVFFDPDRSYIRVIERREAERKQKDNG